MTMLIGYGHIVDFFTSVPWWELNPDNNFFTVPARTSVQTKLTHIVYTRDKAGQAIFYLDGQKQANMTVTGNCSNWDTGYHLALANELTQDRPWLGELYRIAIYDRSFDNKQVISNFKAGRDKTLDSPIVLYDFNRDQGDTIKDLSNVGKPLDLKIRNTSAVKWQSSGGLSINAPVLIDSAEPAVKISSAVRKSQEITIEAWLKPSNTTQAGPARIVTVSRDPGQRNFTLGQKGGAYETRFRTTSTSSNGEPALSSPGGEDDPKQICGLRNERGDLAVIYFPAGGSATIKMESLAKDLKTKWYNPRTGRFTSAKATAGDIFTAPDEEDWALLFQKYL
ncbi:MAG: LamG-like jellyroll fold domain-containing protein [Planctomycetota bacterium]|jgi:hypothetical protein